MVSTRTYVPGDEKGIIELWNKIFGNLLDDNDIFKIDKKWWDWRVLKNPEGFPDIYVASTESGEIVANHMNERFKLVTPEKELILYQGILSMADEKYRGLVLLKLASECAKKMKSENSITYGFPNESSMFVFEKMGWKNAGNIPILGRSISPLFNIFDLGRKSRGLEIKKVENFDESINEFTNKIKGMFKYHIKRDNKLLNWKYSQNPLKKYEKRIVLRNNVIEGYSVFRNAKFNNIKTGIILDLFADNKEAFNALLTEVINYFTAEKMSFISCYMIKNNFYYSSLLKRGFIQIPKFLLPKRNAILLYNADENILNLKDWYISYGDWDCV